jgi:hypothetical protein
MPKDPTHERPRMSTIISRRQHLYYWLKNGHKPPKPPSKEIYDTWTNECIRYVASTLGFDESRVRRHIWAVKNFSSSSTMM